MHFTMNVESESVSAFTVQIWRIELAGEIKIQEEKVKAMCVEVWIMLCTLSELSEYLCTLPQAGDVG